MKRPTIDKTELGALPPLNDPVGPLIERDATTGAISVTTEGLKYIEYLASEFCTRGYIASRLGFSLATWEKLAGKTTDDPPTPLRAAYEAGRAALETETQRYHLLAMRKGNVITPMFISKTEWGKKENAGVTVDVAPKINFVLPGPMSEEDYLKKLGIDGLIDSRKPELRGKSPTEIMGLPQLPAPTSTKGE